VGQGKYISLTRGETASAAASNLLYTGYEASSFKITIKGNCPGGNQIFALNLTDSWGNTWQETVSIPVTRLNPGYMSDITLSSASFKMAYVPGGYSFPNRVSILYEGSAIENTFVTVPDAYLISETEVTWKTWSTVRTWAVGKNYTLPDGQMGSAASGTRSDQEPVTMTGWFGAAVWCNALTEYYNELKGTNLEPVYYNDPDYQVLSKNYNKENFAKENESHYIGTAFAKPGAKGFRLPTSAEWGLAARWRNDSVNTVSGYSNPWFTRGDSASGALKIITDANRADITLYAVWYWATPKPSKTAAVKSKLANSLGLYDMTGNVWEFCYDWSWNPSYIGIYRMVRGGSYYTLPYEDYYIGGSSPSETTTLFNEEGIRLARTAD
jgi:formylglycine-generating enzyme required for sulfatase activity